jgi:hypothetical protein
MHAGGGSFRYVMVTATTLDTPLIRGTIQGLCLEVNHFQPFPPMGVNMRMKEAHGAMLQHKRSENDVHEASISQ